jgi:hypothetical protein
MPRNREGLWKLWDALEDAGEGKNPDSLLPIFSYLGTSEERNIDVLFKRTRCWWIECAR